MNYDESDDNLGNLRQDQWLRCQCGAEFLYSVRDQAFYARMQFTPPRSCKACRQIRKAQHAVRSLLLALVVLGSAAPVQAAIAVVAQTCKASTDNNTVTTDAINSTGANLIVIVKTMASNGTLHPTDSKSNTWTALTAGSVLGGALTQIYFAASPTVGSGHTFTLTETSRDPTLCILALSGAAAAPFDQETGANSAFGLTGQPGSVTPAEANSLIVQGVGFHTAQAAGISINGGYVFGGDADDYTDFAAEHKGTGLAYLIQTTATATNPTWTAGSQNTTFVMRAAVFKAAGAAPSGPPKGSLMLMGVGL
jgi:hypothetical protein